MFNNDQPVIGRYACKSADNFAKVMTFVVLTIRMPLYRAVEDMADVEALADKPSILWGWKWAVYHNIQDNKETIYRTAMDIRQAHPDPEIAERELLAYFADMPGFGLVKAGFVLQLCFGLGGCLDTHNVVRYGLRPADLAASRWKNAKTAKTRNQLLDIYQDLLRITGGCASLWDTWCQYVADNQPGFYDNAEHVSRLHRQAFGL